MEMIRAEKEPVRVFRIIVPVIVVQIQLAGVRIFRDRTQGLAHHFRSYYVNAVRAGQVFVLRVRLTFLSAAADHVDV